MATLRRCRHQPAGTGAETATQRRSLLVSLNLPPCWQADCCGGRSGSEAGCHSRQRGGLLQLTGPGREEGRWDQVSVGICGHLRHGQRAGESERVVPTWTSTSNLILMSGGFLRLVRRPEPVRISGEAGIRPGVCVPARLPRFRPQPGAAAAGQPGPVQLPHQTLPVPGTLLTRSRSSHCSSSFIHPPYLQDAALDNQTLVGPVLGSSVANLSISNLTEHIQFTIRHAHPAQVSCFCPTR